MNQDIVSFLLGQKSGGGGSDTATPGLVGVAGYVGTMELGTVSEFSFSIKGAAGKYAAVLCWTRGTVTPPVGGSLIYEKRRDYSGYENVISLVKVPITSDDFTVQVGNPVAARSGAACFVIDRDFTCTTLNETNNVCDTVTWPAGFSVFCALCGTTFTGIARLENDTYPVCYIWPTDATATGSMNVRAQAGFISAMHQGTALIGANTSNNNGMFVCLHLTSAA